MLTLNIGKPLTIPGTCPKNLLTAGLVVNSVDPDLGLFLKKSDGDIVNASIYPSVCPSITQSPPEPFSGI